jgi:hypothetical protein
LIGRVLSALVVLRGLTLRATAWQRTDSNTRSEQDRAANLDVILAYIKDVAAAQTAQIAALDGKANFGLTAASLLTTGVASLHGVDPSRTAGIPLLPHLSPAILIPAASLVTGFAFAIYLLVVFSAYQAYKVRTYTVVPNPSVLLKDYWNKSPFDTKSTLAATLADAVSDNQKQAEKKATWVSVVMRSLLAEAVLLLALLVLQLGV